MTKPKNYSSRSVKKLPIEQAASILWDMGVKTSVDFHEMCAKLGRFKNTERPATIPSNPLTYYKEVSSIEELLSYRDRVQGRVKQRNVEPPSYEELKALVRKKNIVTKAQYMEAAKSNTLGRPAPTNPIHYYDECNDFVDLIGPRFLEFKEARIVARELGKKYDIENINGWRWLSRNKHRPKNLPSNPSAYYEEFTTWHDFLVSDEE